MAEEQEEVKPVPGEICKGCSAAKYCLDKESKPTGCLYKNKLASFGK